MKYIILLVLLIPGLSFSQEISFEIDNDNGSIKKTLLIEKNKLFNISDSGIIDDIFIFSSSALAKQYLNTLEESIIPRKKIKIGETTLFFDSYKSISYFTGRYIPGGVTSGSIGKVSAIDGLKFKYASDADFNKRGGISGKLTQIGTTKINYHVAASEKGKYRGKVKSIGNKKFTYEMYTAWADKAGYVGEVTSIGMLKIKYYDTDYDKKFKGKLKSIGKVLFKYYPETVTNTRAKLVGKFKEQTGEDKRFVIQ